MYNEMVLYSLIGVLTFMFVMLYISYDYTDKYGNLYLDLGR